MNSTFLEHDPEPIGVKPKNLWLEERIYDLAAAIQRRTEVGIYDSTVYEWTTELKENLELLKAIYQNREVCEVQP